MKRRLLTFLWYIIIPVLSFIKMLVIFMRMDAVAVNTGIELLGTFFRAIYISSISNSHFLDFKRSFRFTLGSLPSHPIPAPLMKTRPWRWWYFHLFLPATCYFLSVSWLPNASCTHPVWDSLCFLAWAILVPSPSLMVVWWIGPRIDP